MVHYTVSLHIVIVSQSSLRLLKDSETAHTWNTKYKYDEISRVKFPAFHNPFNLPLICTF